METSITVGREALLWTSPLYYSGSDKENWSSAMEEGDGSGNPGMEGFAEASEGFGNGWRGGERVVVRRKHGVRGEESGGTGRGHLGSQVWMTEEEARMQKKVSGVVWL